MFTMSLYFIALDGILLQHFFQYMHHVRSNPQSFVRGICNIQFYKEQYDVLPTVPACSWEMWGPFPVTGIGVDHCPVCPGAAVCLCPHLPLPSVSTALTAESPSSEAGPALLEILDMETQVAFAQNVPEECSKCTKEGHTQKRKGHQIALIFGQLAPLGLLPVPIQSSIFYNLCQMSCTAQDHGPAGGGFENLKREIAQESCKYFSVVKLAFKIQIPCSVLKSEEMQRLLFPSGRIISETKYCVH